MSYKIDGESTEECYGRSKKGKVIWIEKNRKQFTEKLAFDLDFAVLKEFGNRNLEERSFRLKRYNEPITWGEKSSTISRTQQEDILLEKSVLICALHQVFPVLYLRQQDEVSFLDPLKLEVAMTLASNTEIWLEARFATFYFSYIGNGGVWSWTLLQTDFLPMMQS